MAQCGKVERRLTESASNDGIIQSTCGCYDCSNV